MYLMARVPADGIFYPRSTLTKANPKGGGNDDDDTHC